MERFKIEGLDEFEPYLANVWSYDPVTQIFGDPITAPIGGGMTYHFDNGYGVDVAWHPGTYGFNEGLYEIAIISKDEEGVWSLDYDTPLTDDVLGYLDDKGVIETMKETQGLKLKFSEDLTVDEKYTVVNLSNHELDETQKAMMVGKTRTDEVKEVMYPGPVKSGEEVAEFCREQNANAVIGNLPIALQSDVKTALDNSGMDIPYLASKTERQLDENNNYVFKCTDIYEIDKSEYSAQKYQTTQEEKKCAWVSRHDPTSEQLEALGPNVQIEKFGETINNVSDLREATKDCDMFMVVCPPDKLQDFVGMAEGRPVLTATMTPGAVNETTGRREMTFKEFNQIDKMDVRTHSVAYTDELMLNKATQEYYSKQQTESLGRSETKNEGLHLSMKRTQY